MIPLVLGSLLAANLAEALAYGDNLRAGAFALVLLAIIAIRHDLAPIRAGD